MAKSSSKPSFPPSGLLTSPDAAKALFVTQSRIRDLLADGTLKSIKRQRPSDGRWVNLIAQDELDSLRAARGATLSLSAGDKRGGMEEIVQIVHGELKKTKNRTKPLTFNQLVLLVDRAPERIQRALEILKAKGINIVLGANEGKDTLISLSGDLPPGGGEPLIVHPAKFWNNKWYECGLTGDNHLGSKHERLDVLNALYDMYESEGITEVYNTGNMIEGEMRLNRHDIKVFTLDGQVNYWIDNYPHRKGITTHFVTGDDHEGWYQRNNGMDIGKHMMDAAERAGRKDLKYLGYVEADIVLKAQEGERLMRIMHPGGGAAYALSYASQKLVESLQGGEKPSIFAYGHYHKFDYNFYREVHCIGTGCTVDQSIFMRKCKIQAHVGGVRLKINQAPDGQISRCMVEWMSFYDRGYYTKPRKF